MTYHRQTHSCMIAVNTYLYYEEANEYCAKTYTGGHLVYILDEETDTFITRNLVTDRNWYYIGLSDKEENGVYKWINGKNVSYIGWFFKKHIPERDRVYVVASWDGWIEVFDAPRKFICQVFRVLFSLKNNVWIHFATAVYFEQLRFIILLCLK
uniref:C-type lectin domain-containing protein n=1 Tax=Biomphalaria glabrata TaxID=6526 RepID=A0A2C9JSB1_BIOGL